MFMGKFCARDVLMVSAVQRQTEHSKAEVTVYFRKRKSTTLLGLRSLHESEDVRVVKKKSDVRQRQPHFNFLINLLKKRRV